MRPFIVGLVWLFVIATSASADNHRPNVVLVLADDLGWSDLACYGADLHETPAIDQLAREGLRYTKAYAPAPVCTPTRASILTGKHPARLQMTIWSEGSLKGPTDRKLIQAESRHDLSLSETTLAAHFQKAGYLTALVGKWHLGDGNHSPETHGFDVNIGGTHWGAPQTFFWPYRGSARFQEFRYVPHLEFGKPGEYLTDRLTDEAIRVIDHAVQSKTPFFLDLSHHAPHTPIEAKAEDVAYFAARQKPGQKHQNPAYAAMIRSLDQSVGRIIKRLAEAGIDQETIVIFTSDNGGYIGEDSQGRTITNNSPLRSGKGTLYEGGLRVPLIVRWPQRIKPMRESHDPVVLTDLFPTLLAAAGLSIPVIPLDGMNLLPNWTDPEQTLSRGDLHFHYPHYYHAPPSTPAGAIRTGEWKLIEYFEDGRTELYQLENDPSEGSDLAGQYPERAEQLRTALKLWRTSVNAAMPRPH